MTDLPDPDIVGTNSASNTLISPLPAGGKERESGGVTMEVPLRDVSHAEVELPKEVAATGVSVQPVSVPIPPSVTQMGVQSVGSNVPPSDPATQVQLPLTDDQIASGLHANIMSSIRWLATWCVRKLKKVHIHIVEAHGKILRVRA